MIICSFLNYWETEKKDRPRRELNLSKRDNSSANQRLTFAADSRDQLFLWSSEFSNTFGH